MTDIYKKTLFINKGIPFLFNKIITEYDMREAGYSLINEYKLLSQNTIDKLKKLSKKERTIEIGNLQKNREFSIKLSNAFIEARKDFFYFNSIEDINVVSIKKDAIFVTKPIIKTKFGKYIEFRPKHKYTSYIQLGNKMEIYYSPANLDVKGISDDNLKLHNDYMVSFIISYISRMETKEKKDVVSYLRRFIDKYKTQKLDVGYYRTFDADSKFITKDGDKFGEYWESEKEELDISYNFFKVILPFLKITLI